MEQLIFFGVIIFFSILESVARSRRARRAEEEGGADLPDVREPRSGGGGYRPPELPTYDRDPSYDDAIGASGPATRPAPRPQPTASSPSSEVLLPGDLLKELEKLAGRKQETRARTLKIPKQPPPLPEPTARPAEPERAHAPPPSSRLPSHVAKPRPLQEAERQLHLTHAGYGTDPSSRARSLQDDLDPLAEARGEDARAIYCQLRSGSPRLLRQAIILREVLGPPVGLR